MASTHWAWDRNPPNCTGGIARNGCGPLEMKVAALAVQQRIQRPRGRDGPWTFGSPTGPGPAGEGGDRQHCPWTTHSQISPSVRTADPSPGSEGPLELVSGKWAHPTPSGRSEDPSWNDADGVIWRRRSKCRGWPPWLGWFRRVRDGGLRSGADATRGAEGRWGHRTGRNCGSAAWCRGGRGQDVAEASRTLCRCCQSWHPEPPQGSAAVELVRSTGAPTATRTSTNTLIPEDVWKTNVDWVADDLPRLRLHDGVHRRLDRQHATDHAARLHREPGRRLGARLGLVGRST